MIKRVLTQLCNVWFYVGVNDIDTVKDIVYKVDSTLNIYI